MLFRSTQLFKFDSSATYSGTEAYVSTKGAYFDASEVVIGDLTKFNTSQFDTRASTSAVVSKQFANYVGTSSNTYFNGQQIVFEDGENFYPSQLKASGYVSSYQFVTSTLGYFGRGTITLSSPTVSSDTEVSITPTSTQLFQFSGSYSNLKATEAYIGAGLSTPAYFNPSEVVIGDLIVYNKSTPNTVISGSATVPNTYNYIGLSPYTYITAQKIGRAHVCTPVTQ